MESAIPLPTLSCIGGVDLTLGSVSVCCQPQSVRSTRLATMMVVCWVSFLASACQPVHDNNEKGVVEETTASQRIESELTADWMAQNDTSDTADNIRPDSLSPDIKMPANAAQSVTIDQDATKAARRVVKSIELSQARLAASRHDKCPKLITPEVGVHRIVRKHEIMQSRYCDYFFYLTAGQTLLMTTSPSSTQPRLIAPVYHDFNDGPYRVTDYDKHIIRVDYTGLDYQSIPPTYDVVIMIN